MVFELSVLNRVYTRLRVCPYYKQDEICLYSKYTKLTMTDYIITWICSTAIANKQDGVHFPLVLNRICILLFFCPRRAQGFKPSAAHIYPNTGRVTRGERTRKDKFNKTCFYSPGDIHFWIYDDVTDNCILDLQRKIGILNAFAPLLFWFLSFKLWDHVIFLKEHERNMWSKRKK